MSRKSGVNTEKKISLEKVCTWQDGFACPKLQFQEADGMHHSPLLLLHSGCEPKDHIHILRLFRAAKPDVLWCEDTMITNKLLRYE